MGKLTRVGDLDLAEDLDFQRREWRLQRFGRAGMGLLLLGGLVGVFGSGPLSQATATDDGGRLRVEYARFDRVQAPTRLRIHIGPGTAPAGRTRIWLDREYLQGILVQQVNPQPGAVAAAGDRLVYTFDVADASRPTTVVFHLRPQRAGQHTGRVGLVDGPSVSFRQFTYP